MFLSEKKEIIFFIKKVIFLFFFQVKNLLSTGYWSHIGRKEGEDDRTDFEKVLANKSNWLLFTI